MTENTRADSDYVPDEVVATVNVVEGNLVAPSNLTLPTSSASKNKKTKKKQCCTYCHKLFVSLPPHLERVHSNEQKVKEFTREQDSAIRKKLIEKIRKEGNYKHNTDPKINTGILIVPRNPKAEWNRTVGDFLVCKYCNAHMAANNLRHHAKKCSGKNSVARDLTSNGRKLLRNVHRQANDEMRNVILPVLRDDEVGRVIRSDKLIVLYGNKLSVQYPEQHLQKMIRGHLRLLGRFLIAMRKLSGEITDLISIYRPKHYKHVVEATKITAGFNDQTKRYNSPNVASTLGTLLKKVGNALNFESIMEEDDDRHKNVKKFLQCFSADFGVSVNVGVKTTRTYHQRNKVVELPTTAAVNNYFNFLESNRKAAFTALKEEVTESNWLFLSQYTLVSLLVFNRRRPGELERVLIEDFRKYKGLDEQGDSEILEKMSAKERGIACLFVRFEIRGKLQRIVPVIASRSHVACIELLLETRTRVNVNENNPHVFGLPGDDETRWKFLSACALNKLFAQKSGLLDHQQLRATELRKHMATQGVAFNLNENEVNDLCQFMGHHKDIHKTVYRQTIVEREITNISNLLLRAQGIDYEEDTVEKDMGESSGAASSPQVPNSQYSASRSNIESSTDNNYKQLPPLSRQPSPEPPLSTDYDNLTATRTPVRSSPKARRNHSAAKKRVHADYDSSSNEDESYRFSRKLFKSPPKKRANKRPGNSFYINFFDLLSFRFISPVFIYNYLFYPQL